MIKPVKSSKNQRAFILAGISDYLMIALGACVFCGWVILTINLLAYALRGLL